MQSLFIVGLGNPGEKFKNTRHNAGFIVIDKFAEKNNFPNFVFSKKSNALISEEEFNSKKIILAKPQTFMNESGKTIKSLIQNSKFKIQNSVVVIHDDIDLPFGTIKIVKGRGSAGHKGVESIIKEIKTNDFIRIRIGIMPKTGKPKNPEDFVIKNFSKEEKRKLEGIIEKAVKIIETLVNEGLERTRNEYNK